MLFSVCGLPRATLYTNAYMHCEQLLEFRAGAMQQEPVVQLGSVLACEATWNKKFTIRAGVTMTG